MFSFISWESFLTIVAASIACYYAFTSLAFYRTEFLHWIKSSSKSTPATPASSDKPTPAHPDQVIGNAKETELQSVRSSSISAEELITAGEEDAPEIIKHNESDDHLLIGAVADLLEEIKTLIQLIAEYRTGKTESKALFNALFIRYHQLQNTSYPLAISFFICKETKGQFSFDLTAGEVISWWDSPTAPSKQFHQPTSL